MNQNFDRCMEMLLVHEGGFVDGNKIGDPGGLTNMGVKKKTWDDFYGDDIDEERMKNITVDDVKPIYRTNYSNLPFMTENPEMVLFARGANSKISIFCTLEINAASNACISI